MNVIEILRQIETAKTLGIDGAARIQLDTGLSGELYGATRITVDDLVAVLSVQPISNDLNAYRDDAFGASKAAGWYHNLDGTPRQRNVGEMLCLVHSEISEAMEGHRKGLQDDHLPDRPMVEVELADAIIRIFDLAGFLGLDLEGAYRDKRAYNDQRADHKLENRALAGGKAY